MALWLLIDGYNVVSPVAAPARGKENWLQRERMRLVQRLVNHLDQEVRERTCVVFDAANPPRDRPSEFSIDGVQVKFAVGYPEADDLIEELISGHSAPKNLAVVSSDHRLQAAARRRGATVFESQQWLDDLLAGRPGLAIQNDGGAGQGSGHEASDKPSHPVDAEHWMREFGFDSPGETGS